MRNQCISLAFIIRIYHDARSSECQVVYEIPFACKLPDKNNSWCVQNSNRNFTVCKDDSTTPVCLPSRTVARVQARDLSTYNRYNVQHDSRILTCSLGSEHPTPSLYYSLPNPPSPSGATFIPAITLLSDVLFDCQFLLFEKETYPLSIFRRLSFHLTKSAYMI